MSDRIRILIVDDDPAVADIVRIVLCGRPNSPFSCNWVKEFEHCLKACENNEADYVILDLDLPDALGLEGPIRLRQKFPEMAIIILTGSGNQFAGQRAQRDLGVIAYIEKPIPDIHEFYQTIYDAVLAHTKEVAEKKVENFERLSQAKPVKKVSKAKSVIKWSSFISAFIALLTALVAFLTKVVEYFVNKPPTQK